MMNHLLILVMTHIAAAGIGAALTYVLVNRYAIVVEHEGHPAIEILTQEERMREHEKDEPKMPWVMTVVVAIAMIVIGVQVYNGQRAEDRRDKADAVYAECLRDAFQTAFTDLIETIETNRSASAAVERAETKRDNAVDRVLQTVLAARSEPPSADESDFDRALTAARDAKVKLRVVRAEAKGVRESNEYEAPEVACER